MKNLANDKSTTAKLIEKLRVHILLNGPTVVKLAEDSDYSRQSIDRYLKRGDMPTSLFLYLAKASGFDLGGELVKSGVELA